MSFKEFQPENIIDTFREVSDSKCKDTTYINLFADTYENKSPIQKKDAVERLEIHREILNRLDEFIEKNQIPHIIFHGPSGSGKQTIVREFIQRIYRHDKVKTKTHVMTVNCSHGKGIQFIREELKFFAKANAQTKSSSKDGGQFCEFKTITLLNAHHLTVDAQSALRRCIELFSYNTRFFIVVENKDKLLNPILSRFCDIFVPEPQIEHSSESINMHQYVLSQQFSAMNASRREDNAEKMRIFDDMFREYSTATASSMELVNRLYELGISCLDLMEWVKMQKHILSPAEYTCAIMRFYQIKPQFRCEKLLMLSMVHYIFRKKIVDGENKK